MPLELWIVLALVVIGGAMAVAARLRKQRRAAKDPGESNVYPLW